MFKNVPVLDTRRAAATTTFVQRGIGDVLLAWENEALLADQGAGAGKVEIVVPSMSVLAEPSVTVVDKVVLKPGTARSGDRVPQVPVLERRRRKSSPRTTTGRAILEIAAKYAAQYPKLNLVTIQELGGWSKVQQVHFGKSGDFRADLRRRALKAGPAPRNRRCYCTALLTS